MKFLPLPFQQFLEGNDLLEPVDGMSAFYARQAGAQLPHRLVDAPPECRHPKPPKSSVAAKTPVRTATGGDQLGFGAPLRA